MHIRIPMNPIGSLRKPGSLNKKNNITIGGGHFGFGALVVTPRGGAFRIRDLSEMGSLCRKEIATVFQVLEAWGPKIATLSHFESPRPENCDSSMF